MLSIQKTQTLPITVLAVSGLLAVGIFLVWFENYALTGISKMPWDGEPCSEIKELFGNETYVKQLSDHQFWRLKMESKWWCINFGK